MFIKIFGKLFEGFSTFFNNLYKTAPEAKDNMKLFLLLPNKDASQLDLGQTYNLFTGME